jgi:hypothetical protein
MKRLFSGFARLLKSGASSDNPASGVRLLGETPPRPSVKVDDDLPPDTVVWRYLQLNAFLELVNGHLVLSRADQFNDDLEGAYDWRQIEFSNDGIEAMGLPLQKRVETDYGRHYPYIDYKVPDLIKKARTQTLMSCWCEYDGESFAMWSAYGRRRESVAISSTVGKLVEFFRRDLRPEFDDEAVHYEVGRVKYEPLQGPVSNARRLFFHKRPSFVAESEIRIVRSSLGDVPPILALPLSDPFPAIVDSVTVAPGSRELFRSAVESVLRHAFGDAACPVIRSTLDENLLP